MKKTNLIFLAFMFLTCAFFAQSQEIKLNPEKVKKFQPYVEFRHGGADGFPQWKEVNKMQYAKEMWYFSESFYVKRDHLSSGYDLNEEIIDISRFESQRKQNEEAIVTLPGFKDAIVLLPTSKLIYKP